MSGGGTVGATRNRTELFLKYRNQARGALRPIGLPGTSPTSRQAERCACLRFVKACVRFASRKPLLAGPGSGVSSSWQGIACVGRAHVPIATNLLSGKLPA